MIKYLVFMVFSSFYVLANAFATQDSWSPAALKALSGVVHDLRGPLKNVILLTEGGIKAQAKELLVRVNAFLDEAQRAHQQASSSNEVKLDKQAILEQLRPQFAEPLRHMQQELRKLPAVANTRLVLEAVNGLIAMLTGKDVEQASVLQVLSEVVNLNQRATLEKGLVLGYKVDRLSRNVLVNKTLLSRVITNLVGNALKFTQQGSVSVKAILHHASASTPALVEISVRDTGPGIATDKLGSIFQKFEQENSAVAAVYGGNGVGLWNVRELVETELRGTIVVESEVGKGSVFTVSIPVEQTPVLQQDAESAVGSPLSAYLTPRSHLSGESDMAPQKTRVLLVDDAKVNRMVANTQLIKMGYAVDQAASGAEALSKLKTGTYDCVLLDVQMPDMDGYETAERIRAFNPRIIILAFSADEPEEVMHHEKAQHFNAAIEKPLKKDDFQRTLHRFL